MAESKSSEAQEGLAADALAWLRIWHPDVVAALERQREQTKAMREARNG